MLVDDDGNEIDPRTPWILQSEVQQAKTLELLDAHKEDLQQEFTSGFVVEPLPSGRVLVRPVEDIPPLVAYLHDPKDPHARLVLDDITPEIWEEWWPKAPRQKGRKLKPL